MLLKQLKIKCFIDINRTNVSFLDHFAYKFTNSDPFLFFTQLHNFPVTALVLCSYRGSHQACG